MGKVEWLKASAKKAYHYYKRNGLTAVISAVAERLQQEAGEKYVYEEPSEEILSAQKAAVAEWIDTPLLSVVVPTYETPEQYLTDLLDSLKNQTYSNWELILADASVSDKVLRVLQKYSELPDSRIRYIKLSENRGIAHNTNEAIREAKGEYIGLLDHDDFLTPDALFEMASAIQNNRKNGVSPIFLYSDEDKCDGEGKEFYEPHLKLDFNPDMLLTNNYVCHFTMMEAETMKKLQLRPEFDGAQDFDLVLRAAADIFVAAPQRSEAAPRRNTAESPSQNAVSEKAFVHIPKVLYHWRCHRDSTAANPESKRYAYEAGKRALEDLASSQGWQVEVKDTKHLGFYELKWDPSVLLQRNDIGALAGQMPAVKGKMVSGIYDVKYTDGAQDTGMNHSGDAEQTLCVTMRYAGLKSGFGGYLHRAELAQNVEAADVRTLQVKPQYEDALWTALAKIQNGEDPVNVSLEFCDRIRKDGLRILWIP